MVDNGLNTPALNEIRAAKKRIAPYVTRTPLIRLGQHDVSIYLKLENLQPIGAFKIRCMGNCLLAAGPSALREGVYTASSGNAGIGLAWMARELGVAATVYAPAFSPQGKLDTMRRYGANVHQLSNGDWWQIIQDSAHPTDPGLYVDAVRNPAAMAGNGTIGLEILEQLPDVTSVFVPFGGGGLACGIATAIKASKPDVSVVVAECDSAAPVTAAFREGRPATVKMQPSFISGAGAPSVLNGMWPLVRESIDSTVVVSETEVANAVRILFEQNRVVAEGAGALSVAGSLSGSLSGKKTAGKTVCVVSGGNIDSSVMAKILLRQPL